jgi:hypothetical protein
VITFCAAPSTQSPGSGHSCLTTFLVERELDLADGIDTGLSRLSRVQREFFWVVCAPRMSWQEQVIPLKVSLLFCQGFENFRSFYGWFDLNGFGTDERVLAELKEGDVEKCSGVVLTMGMIESGAGVLQSMLSTPTSVSCPCHYPITTCQRSNTST